MTQRYLMTTVIHTSHGHVVITDDHEVTLNVVRYQAADMLLDMLTRQTHLIERDQKAINAKVTGYTFTISRLGDL